MEKFISFILSACLVVAFIFLKPEKAFSQTSQDEPGPDTTAVPGGGSPGTYVKGITPMRARALAGVVLGLTSLVIGLRARKRAAAGIGNKGHSEAIIAVSLGAIAIILSIIHLNITGGAVFGSGSGKAGAIFALVLALVGLILGGLVLRKKKV